MSTVAEIVHLAVGSGRDGGGSVVRLTQDARKLLDIICEKKGWSQEEALEQALNFTAQALHQKK